VKIVDIFLAAPKTEARGVIATLLSAHGFRVRWSSPWAAQGDRGSSFGYLFSPGNAFAVKCTVGAQVLDTGADQCAVRLERRFIPTGQNQALLSLELADEFENLCDEVALAFSTDGRVKQVVVYGAPPLMMVDAHAAKPPPPILPNGHAVAAIHTPPSGPPWNLQTQPVGTPTLRPAPAATAPVEQAGFEADEDPRVDQDPGSALDQGPDLDVGPSPAGETGLDPSSLAASESERHVAVVGPPSGGTAIPAPGADVVTLPRKYPPPPPLRRPPTAR